MKGIENIKPDVATDLIELVNSLQRLPKTGKVLYNVQIKSTGEWVKKEFKYVPLDNLLKKIKSNGNFALLQPMGIDANGINGIKCVLVHKTGHAIISDTFPLSLNENGKPQDNGSLISYYKRYSLGAFLGIASDEDIDGNDNDAEPSNQNEPKASPQQINYLFKLYTPDEMLEIQNKNELTDINDISRKVASDLINKRAKK